MLKHLTPGDVAEICRLAAQRHGLEALNQVILIDPDNPAELKAIDSTVRLTGELESRIGGLSREAQAELTALTWLGRGDEEGADFRSLLTYAERTNSDQTPRYLAAKWPLGHYLEAGLRSLEFEGFTTTRRRRPRKKPRPSA